MAKDDTQVIADKVGLYIGMQGEDPQISWVYIQDGGLVAKTITDAGYSLDAVGAEFFDNHRKVDPRYAETIAQAHRTRAEILSRRAELIEEGLGRLTR